MRRYLTQSVLLRIFRSPWFWITAATGLLIPPALLAERAYSAEVQVFFPPRVPLALPVAAAGVPGLAEAAVQLGERKVSVWLRPSSNGATLIFCHGAGGDRSQLLLEARALASAGFGTVLFDWPGHGNTEGHVTWGVAEQETLTGIVDWLVKQPEFREQRLGAIGFSLGGYVLTRVAVADPRIQALALLGTPSNLNDQVRLAHQRWRLIRETSARWALRNNGLDLGAPQPAELIGQFAPRPVLVVGGDQDATVPPQLTQQLFRAAGEPKQLFLIEGAAHGQQGTVGGDTYQARLVEHFRKALVQP